MPNLRSRHPGIGLVLGALVALSNAAACDKKEPDPNAEIQAALARAERAEAARRHPTDAGRPRPRAVASALANLRNTTLDLAPRALPAQALAVGRSRVAQLADGELHVRRLPDLEPVVRAPLRGSAAVTELLDGGLLAVGRDRVLRLDAGRTRWREYPRVTLLPGCFVYPDLIHGERFWVLHPFSGSLFRYELDGDAGGVAFGPFFDLPSFDGRVFSVLKDASLLYTTQKTWRRSYSARRHVPVRAAELEGVLRALPAKRLDQVWLLTRDGTWMLAQLGAGLTVVKRIPTGALPFDAASNDEGLAVLELEQSPARPRRWRLAVYDHSGERRFSADVPDESAPGTHDDWVSVVTRNKNLALSRHEPWVAVGGPTALRVWNMKDGSQIAAR
ncbi:MAG TPA: hypothetical protein VI072_12395 [Polyangiaceae bacterium]